MTEQQLFAIKQQLEKQNEALSIKLREAERKAKSLENRAKRERAARKEAESILEVKSRELYQANIQLADLNSNLENKIKQQIEELEKHVKSLEKANNNIRQFTYLASHDLKTPLRAIGSLMGFIEQDLLSYPDVSEDMQECILLIKTRVNRMHRLLNSILEYSSIGKQKTITEAVWLQEVIKDVNNSLSFDFQPVIKIKDPLFKLEVNKKRIYKVLKHIIENAIKYHDNPDELVINIYSEKDENWAKVFITDNGPGIAKKYHERIFQIFQTLATKDKNKESIGIGLPIVKKIVEDEMNGTFVLESEEGEGATFILSFPITSVIS